MLDDHEANLIGVSYDEDDEQPFIDFKISLQYPIARGPFERLVKSDALPPWIRNICKNRFIKNCQPYFAFTGRFGQYTEERESSPVISKRFNPKLFFRLKRNGKSYLDVEYGHESNGQRVTTGESYTATANELENEDNGNRDYANDYISRGWDYVGITWHYRPIENDFLYTANYANYIGGFLQGTVEEYYDWEERRPITSRDEVSGIKLLVKKKNTWRYSKSKTLKFNTTFVVETGTHRPFEYLSYRYELLIKILGMPMVAWARHGYNSDLALYYKRVNSYGLAFEFRTFE